MQVKKYLTTILLILLSNFTIFFNAHSTVNNLESPDIFLSRVSENAVTAMKRDLNPNDINLEKLNEIVETYMIPYVDFQKTTRLTVGNHWQAATEEQKKQLINLFRKKLIRTYTMALLQVSPNALMSTHINKISSDSNNVVAKSVIQQPNGQKVQIGYRLSMHDEKWKIYDVSIEGLWLIENYRAQFNKEINKHGINSLITKLNNY